MASKSFEDEIARNKRNSLLLMILISAILFTLVYVLVYLIAPEYLILSMPLSVVLILVYTYSSYRHGDHIILSTTNAKPAEGREYQYLRDTVEGLSIAAGVPAPRIYVMESGEINAFATGRDPEHASVTVTTGALNLLERSELEGVLAHEISHIKNRDILFMTLIAVLVGLAAILSHVILRTFWYGGVRRRDRRRRGGGLEMIIIFVGFILAVFAPILVRVIQFAISREREELADANSVEFTRYPEGLASALEKIMKRNEGRIEVSEAVSHLFFVDPKSSPLDRLFATHPPLEERVERLRAM